MGCRDCIKDTRQHASWSHGVCDVCRLLDNDVTEKRVQYCKNCKAHVCESCLGKYGRRFMAMIEEARRKLKASIKK